VVFALVWSTRAMQENKGRTPHQKKWAHARSSMHDNEAIVLCSNIRGKSDQLFVRTTKGVARDEHTGKEEWSLFLPETSMCGCSAGEAPFLTPGWKWESVLETMVVAPPSLSSLRVCCFERSTPCVGGGSPRDNYHR
jgi:hypothetical protein